MTVLVAVVVTFFFAMGFVNDSVLQGVIFAVFFKGFFVKSEAL